MAGRGITVKVLYWAQAREAAGVSSEEVSLERPATIPGLVEVILERHPQLAALGGSVKIAVNGQISGQEVELKEGDEVALLPPVSGG